ncbi:hypothetical protein MMAD_12130 [Mycolicibacterium madagascariense]|uniref:Uncharacterized protein n=1 Tax=Mycolicibacterium madagascariense TaxID=212765 RepID=A0A7I7XE52_9MYCO|nr:hypothetical protein MMAD_12130 [Mycolicibacterium madagascariense]
MGSRRPRKRLADNDIDPAATATHAAAPAKAIRRAAGSEAAGTRSSARRGGAAAGAGRAPSALTAARASTVPWPESGSQPAVGWWAVSQILRITCRAVSSGATDRTSATMPDTIAAA